MSGDPTNSHPNWNSIHTSKEDDQEQVKLDGEFKKYVRKHKGVVDFIPNDIIGKESTLLGPYGRRRIVYCDHIASSRAMNSIENYVKERVLPRYGNTHTTTTATSRQASMFQHEARTIVRNAVRADKGDAVIFVGNGVTSAIHKLISVMNFKNPPVVFVGPFEHHSNILPWRHLAEKVVFISEASNGHVNMEHLEIALKEWSSTGLEMIGCFSAASNVTGVTTDTVAVSALLHKYGAIACWDYATAGPYLPIDMHPVCNSDASKDAVFLSMHKFLGGVDAPGILIAKRKLFRNPVPSCGGGGGSILFVTQDDHRYLKEEELREEGGTPRVVGIVRSALAFTLKECVGADEIMRRENDFYNSAMKIWNQVPNLHFLGKLDHEVEVEERLAIFSFLILHPQSKLYLHHNFIACLLNDIFGIQARGGCACAGPYAQALLSISGKYASRFGNSLVGDSRLDREMLGSKEEYSPHEVLRPGFTRLNIPYFAKPEEADFIIRAVKMVAEMGWSLLPQYMFNPQNGEWKHCKQKTSSDRRWLGHIRFTKDGMKVTHEVKLEGKASTSYKEILKEAEKIFHAALKGKDKQKRLPDQSLIFEDVPHLRWFLLPTEAQQYLMGNSPQKITHECPISVRKEIKQLTAEEIDTSMKVGKKSVEPAEEETEVESKSNEKQNNSQSVKKLTIAKHDRRRRKEHRSKLVETKGSEDDSCYSSDETSSSQSSLIESPYIKRANLNANETGNSGFKSPPKQLFDTTLQVIEEFGMIEDHDRVLVCLSGGKDSLCLLHILHHYQISAKEKGINFELGAVTFDPRISGYDPSPLVPYLASLGVPHFYEVQAVIEDVFDSSSSSISSYISRMKQIRIQACARRENWNVLAFAQHLDDLAEHFLVSAFYKGSLSAMKASHVIEEGDLRVIRPFIYTREIIIKDFAQDSKLPVIPKNPPTGFEFPKEFHKMKQLLASQEIVNRELFPSLKETISPLIGKKNQQKKNLSNKTSI